MDDDTRLIELALWRAKTNGNTLLAYILEMALLEARDIALRHRREASP